jgi:hypothetical protein
MSRREGTIIAGRWLVGRELPGGPEIARYEASDRETGAQAEITELKSHVRLRPGADAAFARAASLGGSGAPFSSVSSSASSAAIRRRQVLPTNEGTVAVGDPTLGSLAGATLTPTQALDLAAWLGPAVLEAAPFLRGWLRPEDIVLEPTGIARLAPNGLAWSESLLELPHGMAPEVLAGGPAVPESGLYGLGFFLYRAVTASWPYTAVPRNLQDLLRQTASVPASALKPEIPAALDTLLAGLLDRFPARRREALLRLAIPADPPTFSEEILAPAAPPERTALSQTASLSTLPRRVVPPGDFHVLAELHRGPKVARLVASALSGFALDEIERAASRSQPVLVGTASSPQAALEIASRVQALGVPARVAGRGGSGKATLWILGSSALMAGLVALAFSTVTALVLAVIGLSLAILAATRPVGALLRGQVAPASPDPAIAHLQGRVLALLAALVDRPLPSAIATDLRDDLVAVWERLSSLGSERNVAQRQISDQDEGAIRAELARAHQNGAAPRTEEMRSRLGRLENARRLLRESDRELGETSNVLDELERNLLGMDSSAPDASSDALARIAMRIQAMKAATAELGGRTPPGLVGTRTDREGS